MRMVAPRTGLPEITIAENQEQYLTITAAKWELTDGSSGVLLRFRPTPQDLARLVAGEDVYVALTTFGFPMQPILVQVGPDGYVVDPAAADQG